MSAPVLVGYDRSESGERALDRAIALCNERHAPLLVLAVHEAPLDPTGPRAFGTLGDGSPMEGPFPELPDLHEVLQTARDRVEDGAVAKADYVWAIGEPGALIVETAQQYEAQVIVVGHSHHGFLGRLFGADVSAEVEKHAGIPVEVVEEN
jgi:nucleotide-binding universal stress UspA family protein